MATIYAYLSAVWAGIENPLWPHLVLIPGSVLAGIAVGAGIVFERPTYSDAIHRVAFWLIVTGIAVESLCTVLLFVVDERVSAAQLARIDELTKETTWPRMFGDIDDCVKRARLIKPAPYDILYVDGAPDTAFLSDQIDACLRFAWSPTYGSSLPKPITPEIVKSDGEFLEMGLPALEELGGQQSGVSFVINRAMRPLDVERREELMMLFGRYLHLDSGGVNKSVPTGSIRILVGPRE